MAGYVALRDALVTALETVDDIGVVHDYRRLVLTREPALAAFTTTIGGDPVVQFADVDLTSLQLVPGAWQNVGMRMSGPVSFTVRCYRAIDDASASGRAFAVLLEAASEAIAAAFTGVEPRHERVPVTLVANEHRFFGFPGSGDVLCHYGELVVAFDDSRTV